MAAIYYLGRHQFTSKKTGKPCYVASLLAENRDGWQGVDKFITESVFNSIEDLDTGAAVRLDVDLRGEIMRIQLDTEFAPIQLGMKLGEF